MQQRWCTRVAALLVSVAMMVGGGFASPASADYSQNATASWVPNGTVYAIAVSGSRVYLGGAFTSLTNPATGETVARSRLAAVDAATGALVKSWNPGANGTVRALAVGSDGTVYAGGAFTAAAGVNRSRMVAITSTGAPVSGWRANANRTVRDIAIDSRRVYMAGAFGTINGTKRARLARVSAATGALHTKFNARVGGGYVHGLAIAGDKLLLGGSFKTLSGASRVFSGSVLRSSGARTSWKPRSQCDTCRVLDVATDGSKVYQGIAGPGGRAVAFSLSSGKRVWSKTGDGDVQAVDVHDGVVYAGGHFSNFAGTRQRQLVALAPSSGASLPHGISFTGSDAPGVWAVHADAAALRLGGGFKLSYETAARYAAFSNV